MVFELSTSPSSVATGNLSSFAAVRNKGIALDEFLTLLPDTIRKTRDGKASTDAPEIGHRVDPIANLFQRLTLRKDEWERYACFDPSQHYTRNLVSTDNENFTLLILCWNPGRTSPIHDHPCDGCWMRVCEGSVREERYVNDTESDSLRRFSDRIFTGKLTPRLSLAYNSLPIHSQETPIYSMIPSSSYSTRNIIFNRGRTRVYHRFYGIPQGWKSKQDYSFCDYALV
eukprot:scaffold25804_cov58-Attheya_sp.AAC.2